MQIAKENTEKISKGIYKYCKRNFLSNFKMFKQTVQELFHKEFRRSFQRNSWGNSGNNAGF